MLIKQACNLQDIDLHWHNWYCRRLVLVFNNALFVRRLFHVSKNMTYFVKGLSLLTWSVVLI